MLCLIVMLCLQVQLAALAPVILWEQLCSPAKKLGDDKRLRSVAESQNTASNSNTHSADLAVAMCMLVRSPEAGVVSGWLCTLLGCLSAASVDLPNSVRPASNLTTACCV